MAQHFLSHAGQTSGSSPPSGFTERWTASGSFGTGTDCAEWTPPGSNQHDFLEWTTVGSISGDAEILALFRADSTTGNQGGVVVQGATGATSGYYITLLGGTDIYIVRMDAGSEASFANTGFTWSANTDYWLRAGRSSGDIRARVWADGGSEPGTWTVTMTDSTYSSGSLGYLGRGAFSTKQWKQIGVGTGGDSAPSTTPATGHPHGRLALLGIG